MPGRKYWLHAGCAAVAGLALAHSALLWVDGSASATLRVTSALLPAGLVAICFAVWRRLRAGDRAYRDLQHSERRLSALIDSVAEGMFMVDLDGRITAINRASARSINQSPQSATGKVMTDFLPKADGEKMNEVRLQVIATQKMVRVERSVTIGARQRWYDIIYVPVWDQAGLLTDVAAMARDMTARHAAEERASDASAKLAESVRKLEQVNASMQLFTRLTDALQTCASLDEAYEVLRKYCGRLLTGVRGNVYLQRASRDLLEPVATFGDGDESPDMMSPEDCLAIRRGQAHTVTNPETEMVCGHFRAALSSSDGGDAAPGPASSLCLPLAAQGDVIGLLTLRFEPGYPIDEATQRLARSIAEQIALSLSGLRLREQLRRQSIVDSLTGLYNRRFLDESLLREFARAARKSVPLALLMMDIDHFKKWNDTRGHDAGDQVLRLVGSELQRAVRGSDIACRFGGEEFAILMPEASPEVAVARANYIRERISLIDVEYGGQIAGRITISIGVAAFPPQATDAHALVRAADAALYEAKGAGRDRVMLAPALPKPARP